MKRGDVVIATAPGFGTKPRPWLVVQSDDYLVLSTVILLPFTSTLADPPSRLRVSIAPDSGNGLLAPSQVMTDIPMTTHAAKVHQLIGTLSETDLARVEQAMLLALGFAR